MIRAAIATKRKYGSVTLTEEQVKCFESISGQKLEKTWLGQAENDEIHTLDMDENGNYLILLEQKELKEAVKNG